MDRLLVLALLAVGGFIAWRRGMLDKLLPIGSANAFALPAFNVASSSTGGGAAYLPPSGALPYLAAIRQAERANGIPADLLVRLLDQESRYRADVIDGRVSSRVGAKGIAQVMPATAKAPGYGVPPLPNPLDPFASIAWAAKYLAALRARFGNWSQALAAYNFGPGNVIAGKAWPTETRNYVAQITRDVKVA
ncbi:MAG TPA: lytic transglycosylase domain-containing protein [Vicinamibacterales bacterium]